MLLLSKNDIKNFTTNFTTASWKDSWKIRAFTSFERTITNREKKFPCTLGVAGFAADQLRYFFVSHDPESEAASVEVAAALQSFLPCARSFGKNTSLVIFFDKQEDSGIEVYKKIFWSILDRLHYLDAHPWSKDIPQNPDDKDWEFSFGGEPVFVVCNTPFHKARLGRYSANFMITFQPRWVFDGIIVNNVPDNDKLRIKLRLKFAGDLQFLTRSPLPQI